MRFLRRWLLPLLLGPAAAFGAALLVFKPLLFPVSAVLPAVFPRRIFRQRRQMLVRVAGRLIQAAMSGPGLADRFVLPGLVSFFAFLSLQFSLYRFCAASSRLPSS